MSTTQETVQREWILEGLDCANCARKIENGVQKVNGVTSCNVNFITKKLTLETEGKMLEFVTESVRKKVKSLEPHIQIIDAAAGKRANARVKSAGQMESGQAGHLHSSHDHSQRDDDHVHGQGTTRKTIYRLIAAAVMAVIAYLFTDQYWLSFAFYVVAYVVIGGDILLQAGRNLVRGQLFDEYFLMSVATLAAFSIGEYPEGVAVMLFYQIGEMFQGIAVNRSRNSITSLLDIRPDAANLLKNGEVQRVSPEDVQVGDHIQVRPGEKIPLDGEVITGRSMVDTSALTGESVPRSVDEGEQVLSGMVNKNGVLVVEVKKEFGESTVSKILELVQNASSKKAPTEKFITKFSRYYTPAVVIIAALMAVIPPLVLGGATFTEWIYRATIFLVISCPCALVVSIPLGFFGGIGSASKIGVLIKGGNYLEALNSVKYTVFDKTGTLTKGSFKVTGVFPTGHLNETDLLETTALAELHSTHPIAESVKEAFGGHLDASRVDQYEEISGHGIQAIIDGQKVLAGNAKLMQLGDIAFTQSDNIGTVVHLAVDGAYVGHLIIADEVKGNSASALAELKKLGVKKRIMLTGDAKAVAEAVGKQLGLDEVHAELLPQDKVKKVEELVASKTAKEKILFVGDGINDTPVLARADVGVAMGGLGSDAAIEAADIVIMNDDLSKLPEAMMIARRTRQIVWQNIIFALGVKAMFLTLGAFGIATMWEAVIADVGVTLLAVLNVMRVLKTDKIPNRAGAASAQMK
ncbi:heavy metal translocating P-type ATPase [Aureibacillus halotolerans]|uniref:Cd(2+)-exporting ATPase n=1 Tax=Aureibacillus halotolerans TaxID=1508390 RepID=A0A4R6U0F6_9BACI|nr:heavy metal translocating P-type ATPase [Aureibacillus halotolerans]TDQ39750.1 Cd2+/Zn2+-exporting ATPase [Aureibacillus halotolerans]